MEAYTCSRSSPSGSSGSSNILHASASVEAARSRSLSERCLTLRSSFSALVKSSRSSRSSTSRASSCALASRQCTKATSVAMRRACGNRATADTLAVLAKRASAAMRLGGTWLPGSLMPRLRTLSMRNKASTSAGALTRTGPLRSRSSQDWRLPSAGLSRSSRRCLCSTVTPRTSKRHKRNSTRERTSAMKRSSTVTPGSSTL